MLNFWLLSEAEIDEIARYYSQVEPDPYTLLYPHPMNWDDEVFKRMDETMRVFMKRRELALFIGLRIGMESIGH